MRFAYADGYLRGVDESHCFMKELLAKHSRVVTLADQVPRPFIPANGYAELLKELGYD